MNTVFETYNQTYSDHQGARLNFNTPFQLGTSTPLSLIYGVDLLKDHTVQKTMKDDLVTPDMNMDNIAFYSKLTFLFSINNLFNANYYPTHAEVRGATNEGRYYIKGRGTMANFGVQLDI
ncbi:MULTISPECIES: hypothetical protein [Sphingobacterium]|uniref:hypothetical protein n=1 Tax=Sphingobacterium TaxID=28453 RepID=UPI0013E47C28|nr:MULTISPECIES: hypothetical protein [Sphingobacterium]QIH34925.1 hypothetical protein G6053_19380 [Sphingobacterium sp. DR205]